MSRATLILRSLVFHARTQSMVLLSCAVACAIISGALTVGDSVRGSLRDRSLERLGPVEWSLQSELFFRAELADDLNALPDFSASFQAAIPVISISGTIVHAESGRRVTGVHIVAADDRFEAVARDWKTWKPRGRSVVLTESVAKGLDARPGDSCLLYFKNVSDIARETALGDRGDAIDRLRLEVQSLVPEKGGALFDLRNQQENPLNVFVPLAILQRALEAEGRANVLLAVPGDARSQEPTDEWMKSQLAQAWKLSDFKLALRSFEDRPYLSFESEEFLLLEPVARAAAEAARKAGLPYLRVSTYLANALSRGDRSVPYSMVCAVDDWSDGTKSLAPSSRVGSAQAVNDQAMNDYPAIALSRWAADRIGAEEGDDLELSFYSVGADESLIENEQKFTVTRIVPLAGEAADPHWTPEHEGLSDVRTIGDWKLPFEIDDTRLGDDDEKFWDEHGTTPKAFLELAEGRRLWGGRFGELTSIRIRASEGDALADAAGPFEDALRKTLTPDALGMRWQAVRTEALEAAAGGTDFSMLFVALSFFIIVAALMLVAMTFRLTLSQRARELGMLRALGFPSRTIRRDLSIEALTIAGVGCLLGLLMGIGYGAALIAGLKSWWKGAVNAPFLSLHVEPMSLAISAGVTLILVYLTIRNGVKRAAGTPPRELLMGSLGDGGERRYEPTRGRAALYFSCALILIAALSIGLARFEWIGLVVGYLTTGSCLFGAGLCAFFWFLSRPPGTPLRGRGLIALARLGIMNGRRARWRSSLTMGLIASATFIVVTIDASRSQPESDVPDVNSGNGGISLVLQSTSPLYANMTIEEGREDLGLSEDTASLLGAKETSLFPFRERPGDETSCLNLYAPREPRILGAAEEFVRRGGFRWASSLAETEEEKQNPWSLLKKPIEDGGGGPIYPAIGDQNTVMWILKSGLGKDITMTDGQGRQVRLRLVGLLSRSLLQGALVVSDASFLELFPRLGGWSTFFIECSEASRESLTSHLENELSEYGADVTTSAELLASFQAVENTYLSTFFVLGGLGLMLGTLGLGATLLRSVLERRGELGLLSALGYSRRHLSWVILSESLALLVLGVVLGTVSALLATYPSLSSSRTQVSWPALLGTVIAVLAVGSASCLGALRWSLRVPLLQSLRGE